MSDSRRHYSARTLGRLMNFYPPLLGSGIRVRELADDWTRARVELRLTRLNRNQHGTAFGGSLGAMTDAFYALLVMHQLGKDYKVWDQAAEITYVNAGTGTVYAQFDVPTALVDRIRAEAANGRKVLEWFELDLTLADGTVVARVRRQLYIRKRRSAVVADRDPAATPAS